MKALEKMVDQIAAANGYRWSIDFSNGLCGPTRIRIDFKHVDSTKNWVFYCRADTAAGLLDKMVTEFLSACRASGFNIPGDEPKLVGCKVCGGELVKIRGHYPKSDKRLVCPTCQADTLADISARLSPNYNTPSTESPK